MVEKCYIPKNLDEALQLRKDYGCRPLAGGSDLMVQYRQGVGITPTFPFPVMIITGLVEELKGISVEEDGSVLIKALTTPSEIASDERVPYLVRQAAGRMGAIALRNSATIGGNIGNASPKGDLPQPLILLDAEVILQSREGGRTVLLDDFIQGSKKTDLHEDELIVGVRIPRPNPDAYLYYRKIGTRRANAISKLSLSALMVIDPESHIITDFRASSGAAGNKVKRSREAENLIKNRSVGEVPQILPSFLEAWDAAISPHAMPEYRRNTTRRMLEYFITRAIEMPEERIVE